MNSFEGKKEICDIVELTPAEIKDLVGIRSSVDGVEDVDRLKQEAERYAKELSMKAFLSEIGEEVIGYVEVKLEENELPNGAPEIKEINGFAHLARIGVVEKFRGRGIGKSLLLRAEEWAKNNGRQGIWLDYLVSNQGAERLYKSAGYTDVAEFMDTNKQKLRRIAIKSISA